MADLHYLNKVILMIYEYPEWTDIAKEAQAELTTLLAESLIAAMMKDPRIRITNVAETNARHLYWAPDTKQWDVYKMVERQLQFIYQGPDLAEAVRVLTDKGEKRG